VFTTCFVIHCDIHFVKLRKTVEYHNQDGVLAETETRYLLYQVRSIATWSSSLICILKGAHKKLMNNYNCMGQSPCWETDSHSAVQFYRTQWFITMFTGACHWSLSWARQIQSTPSPPVSFRCILTLSSHQPISSLQLIGPSWVLHVLPLAAFSEFIN
jgi:hypothetical protein